MTELESRMIDYFVICINEFAKRYNMAPSEAIIYLDIYKGLQFLEEFYDIEHTLSFDDAVDDLTVICQKHGGYLNG